MKKIYTKNKELYRKLNLLNFSNIVVLDKQKNMRLKPIIRNINEKSKKISIKNKGDRIILRKLEPFDLAVYLSNSKYK